MLDGACDLEEVVDEAARRKMPAVAVTDHGNLFAAESFYHAAKTRGVKPIIGCEVYVAKGSRHDRGETPQREAGNGHANAAAAEPGQRGNNHLVLLCENAEGYRNLIKLVSAGYLEGFYYKPRIDYDLLAKHSSGLIALSACLRGAVTENLVEEQPGSGARSGLPPARHFREGKLLSRNSGPGPGDREARQSANRRSSRAKPAFRWLPRTIATT